MPVSELRGMCAPDLRRSPTAQKEGGENFLTKP